METENSDEFPIDRGHEDAIIRSGSQALKLGANEVIRGRVPETHQKRADTRGVRRGRFVNLNP